MWQPDIKIETATFPAGGVAPSSHALALHTYIQKARARHDYIQKARAWHDYIQKARAWLRRR